MRLHLTLGVILLYFFLTGCGSIPQPFQKTTLNKSELTLPIISSSAGVVIKGIKGPVGWVGDAFAKAMAESLRKRGIIASSKWSNRLALSLTANGYQQLHTDRAPELVVSWLLVNSNGDIKGIKETRSTPPDEFWNQPSGKMFEIVADTNADEIANWINPSPLINKKTSYSTIRMLDIKNAPGDSALYLFKATKAALSHQDIRLVKNGKSDLTLRLIIKTSAIDSKNHNIRLDWILKAGMSKELGAVSQKNVIETQLLIEPWDSLAKDIAIGAVEGLMQLINQYNSTLSVDVPHRMQ